MSILIHIAAQAPLRDTPEPLQEDAPFVNVTFEFAQLPPIHQVLHACEVIFSSLFVLTAAPTAHPVREARFLVESLLYFDECRLTWCDVISAAQLHPGTQLFCISPMQCSLLPSRTRTASVELLEAHGKQLLPASDMKRVVRWPSAESQEALLRSLRPLPRVIKTEGSPRCLSGLTCRASGGGASFSSSRISSSAHPIVAPADRSLYEDDAQGRPFSTRVHEVFEALDTEKRTFLLLRDFYDFAARYTLPASVLAAREAPAAASGAASARSLQHTPLSPFLDENMTRLNWANTCADDSDAASHADVVGAAAADASTSAASHGTAQKSRVLVRTCDFDNLLRLADTDRDGRISFAEWSHFCLTYPRVLALFDAHLHPSSLNTPSPSHAGVRRAVRSSKAASDVAPPEGVNGPCPHSRGSGHGVSSTTRTRSSSSSLRPRSSEAGREDTHSDHSHEGDADGVKPRGDNDAPHFMQPLHSQHRCFFRQCAACQASRAAQDVAFKSAAPAKGAGARVSLPWGYGGLRRHTV